MNSVKVFQHYYQQLNVNSGPTGVDIVDYDVNEEGIVDECIIYLPTTEAQTGDTINIFTFDNNQNDDLELRFRCEDDTAINNRKNAFRRFDCDGFADQFKCIYHSSVGWVVMQLSYVD
jgi:hypothetical protein